MPTVAGVGLMGSFAFCGGCFRFFRDVMKPKKGDSSAPRNLVAKLINDEDVPVSAMDVDAAFARYMSKRPSDAPAYAAEPAPAEPAAPPPPRGFGRKGI